MSILLLQEDDCAPDAWEYFIADFPSYSGGLSFDEFKSKARQEDVDDGFTKYWYLDKMVLSISDDDPFYSLHLS
jgi:hypothetical protein